MTYRHCSTWETHLLDQPRKAGIGPQPVERRFDLQQGNLPVPRLDCLLEPFECRIHFAQPDMQHRDADRRGSPGLRDSLQFVHLRKRLAATPGPGEGVNVRRYDVRAST